METLVDTKSQAFPMKFTVFRIPTILLLITWVSLSVWAKGSEAVQLFDGETLEGWHAVPRLYVPATEEFEKIPSAKLREAVVAYHKKSSNAGCVPR